MDHSKALKGVATLALLATLAGGGAVFTAAPATAQNMSGQYGQNQGYGGQYNPNQAYGGGQYSPNQGYMGQSGQNQGYGGQAGSFGYQGSGQYSQNQISGQEPQRGGQNGPIAQAEVRRMLQQAGLRNIQILDESYLVSAETSSGHPVLLVVNPPGSSSRSMNAATAEGARQSGGFGNQASGGRYSPNQGYTGQSSQNQGYGGQLYSQSQAYGGGQYSPNQGYVGQSGQNQGYGGQPSAQGSWQHGSGQND